MLGTTRAARAKFRAEFRLTVDQGEPGSRFKACVSFGQDNGMVYCTVPATSTQGVIAEEDKAKQAKDGRAACAAELSTGN